MNASSLTSQQQQIQRNPSRLLFTPQISKIMRIYTSKHDYEQPSIDIFATTTNKTPWSGLNRGTSGRDFMFLRLYPSTYLPTYLLTYSSTYLATYLPTYLNTTAEDREVAYLILCVGWEIIGVVMVYDYALHSAPKLGIADSGTVNGDIKSKTSRSRPLHIIL